MANKQMLIKAAEKFVNKVEAGRARSKETYQELKQALSAQEKTGKNAPEVDELIDFVKQFLKTYSTSWSNKAVIRRIKEFANGYESDRRENNAKIHNILAYLDDLNSTQEIDYSIYTNLHDMIFELRSEPNGEKSSEQTV